jgi:hypothetical protein
MKGTNKLDHFQARIFAGSQIFGDSEFEFSGKGDQWMDYRSIKLPGFDGSQTLNLDDFWSDVFTHQHTDISAKLTGQETIVKYSNTQQLKEPFTIVASLTYGNEDN